MRYKRIAFQLFAALGATTQGNLFAADAPAAVKIVREFPISAEPGWPEGVLAILKDVTCSEKLEDDLRFNFEGPHADSWYGLAIRNMEDVNRLIRYFAAIKAESLTLYLRPERGSFLGRGEGAIFSFWNQKILDEWFRADFRKSSLGIRTFGLHRYKKPLKAEVRLTIFAGNPAVNLTKSKSR